MKEPLIIESIGGLRVGEFEPGNATRYTAVAVRWQVHKTMGAMGYIEDGWLVVSGNSGRAYLFQKRGILLDEYIQEHLGGFNGDYPYFGDLIRKLIGRT